jgi:hypothetical protein
VTDRLQGITTWDPIKAGNVTIYEYADGRKFIADGHQRVGLGPDRIEQRAVGNDGRSSRARFSGRQEFERPLELRRGFEEVS